MVKLLLFVFCKHIWIRTKEKNYTLKLFTIMLGNMIMKVTPFQVLYAQF